MASLEDKLFVLLEKLKDTDDSLSVCVVLLQQYLRHEKEKIAVICCQVIIKPVLCNNIDELNSQNKHLNPIYNSDDNDKHFKEQEKRTIFKSKEENFALAKHVGLHPHGGRYVIGYSPVDLKLVPVLRPPIRLRPSYRPRPLRPIIKPIVVKPAHEHIHEKPLVIRPIHTLQPILRPVHRPVGPIVKPIIKPIQTQGCTDKPWQDEWKEKPAIVKPVIQQPPVVIIKPFAPPATVVKPVEPNPAIVTILKPLEPSHIHVKPLPPTQILPVQSPSWVPLTKPAVPLFQVTRPNLPVLPLGAIFPSPVFQEVPKLIPQPLHPIGPPQHTIVGNPPIQNVVPFNRFFPYFHHTLVGPTNIQPVAQQIPQVSQPQLHTFPSFPHFPGLQVHQDHQLNHISNLQQVSSVAQNPQVSNHLHQLDLPQHIKEQTLNAHQYTQENQGTQQLLPNVQQYVQENQGISQPLPNIHQYLQETPVTHQQLPNVQQYLQETQGNHQQLPNVQQYLQETQGAHQQLPNVQQYLQETQGTHQQLPNFNTENTQLIPNDQQIGSIPENNYIQPGQTDLQLPLYLPQHPNFNPNINVHNNLQEPFQTEGGFQPSTGSF